MVDRIAPAPTLSPTASPVDRFVAPVSEQADPNTFMAGLADALSTLNPELQQYMANQNEENAKAQEAEGAQAESEIDARYQFEKGRESWQKLIASERKRDAENGTANAERLAAASPHFRRGLMKSRLNRIGMGLNDFLMNQWRDNPVIQTAAGPMPLQDVDDPAALQTWVAQQTKGYTDQYGTTNMDPLLVGETLLPRVAAAQDGFLSRHTEFRLQKWQEDYQNEASMNVGMILAGGGTNASPEQAWIDKMAISESSGNYGKVNTLGYFGLLQWGDARLTDFNRANGTNYTKEQFLASPALQREANLWHVRDLDKYINASGYLDKGWSLDGLRAVGHLGGTGGIDAFVQGKNRSDAYGTSLRDYYEKFSGPSADLQQVLDNGHRDGANMSQLNKTVVDQVILQAEQAGNSSILGLLDTLDTGSGPLGNIGWVKEARFNAEKRIESAEYTRQQREAAAEKAEREQRSLVIQTEATQAVFDDPYADVSTQIQMAIDNGDPDLARELNQLSESLKDQDVKVRTNDQAVMAIRMGIARGDLTERQAQSLISQGVINGDFDQSIGRQLMDDAADKERFTDLLSDSRVQDTMNDFERIVAQNFQTPGEFGSPPIPGTAQGVEARQALEERIIRFISDEPEATRSELRQFAREEFDRMIKMPFWKPTEQMLNTGEVGDFGMRKDLAQTTAELQSWSATGYAMPTLEDLRDPARMNRVNQLAQQSGLTTQQFLERYGIK